MLGGLAARGHPGVGVDRSAEALAAITNPTVNSYKRINAPRTLSGATWSPNTVTYTGNNRTHMIRIPEPGRFESDSKASFRGFLASAPWIWPGRDYLVYEATLEDARTENSRLTAELHGALQLRVRQTTAETFGIARRIGVVADAASVAEHHRVHRAHGARLVGRLRVAAFAVGLADLDQCVVDRVAVAVDQGHVAVGECHPGLEGAAEEFELVGMPPIVLIAERYERGLRRYKPEHALEVAVVAQAALGLGEHEAVVPVKLVANSGVDVGSRGVVAHQADPVAVGLAAAVSF